MKRLVLIAAIIISGCAPKIHRLEAVHMLVNYTEMTYKEDLLVVNDAAIQDAADGVWGEVAKTFMGNK